MAGSAIAKLRDNLHNFVAASDGASSARELVAAFRSGNGDVIADAQVDLETIALVKLVGDVGKRRQKSVSAGQADLFLGFSIPGTIMVQEVGGGRPKRMRKAPMKATLAEVEAYLHRAQDRRPTKPDAGLISLLDRIRPFMSSSAMTIEEGLAALEAYESMRSAAPMPG